MSARCGVAGDGGRVGGAFSGYVRGFALALVLVLVLVLVAAMCEHKATAYVLCHESCLVLVLIRAAPVCPCLRAQCPFPLVIGAHAGRPADRRPPSAERRTANVPQPSALRARFSEHRTGTGTGVYAVRRVPQRLVGLVGRGVVIRSKTANPQSECYRRRWQVLLLKYPNRQNPSFRV